MKKISSYECGVFKSTKLKPISNMMWLRYQYIKYEFIYILWNREGSMFADTMGYNYQHVYVPTKLLQSNELSYSVMSQTSYPQNEAPKYQ